MLCLTRPWGHMHVRDDGPADAPALLFANSLGTDLRMWDFVVARLPGLRCIRFDPRGHGLSASAPGAWRIEDLADDAEAILDLLAVERAVVVGCSLGGMAAQAFAAARPGRVAGLVLSNTAAQIGTEATWRARIDAVEAGGMAAIAAQVMARWFAPPFLARPEARLWETMLLRCDPKGYAAACAAVAAADLAHGAGGIRAPTVMIAGSADQATPPDLVAATAALIPGARFVLLEGSGHIPAIDAPDAVAAVVRELMEGTAP